jgi:hypothetical protein
MRGIRSGDAGGDPCLPVILLGAEGGELELLPGATGSEPTRRRVHA